MNKLVTAGLLFFVSISSHAYQVQLTGTSATGILGLDIGGTLYDVVFEYVTGPHTTPDQGDIFATNGSNETGAADAVRAINAALNSSIAASIGTGGPPADNFIIPYLFNNATCDTLCAKRSVYTAIPGVYADWLGPSQADIGENTGKQFARFTPANTVVPLPPAVFLFSSGIAFLSWVRRWSVRSQGS